MLLKLTPLLNYMKSYEPKLFTCLREGYAWCQFYHDSVAGLIVAIVAFPLTMALAIASGATPEKGLITALIAGFFISFLGGSRTQIGGPTGAFIVVIFSILQKYGYDGLALATLMAGSMLIMAGFFRLGSLIAYVPQTVMIGFTSGIAVVIFIKQLKDFFGLPLASLSPEFHHTIIAYFHAMKLWDPSTTVLASITLIALLGLQRLWPKFPSLFVVIASASFFVWISGINTPTIGTKYGAVQSHISFTPLPFPTLERLIDLFPPAFTIALLAGLESLLSAVIADAMSGGRHRSNVELIAQGSANIASILFGGLPATGAIARTAINIRAGARTPVAGIVHALLIGLFMWLLMPLVSYIPLAALAAILIIVAWNMSEFDEFLQTLKAPWEDRIVLILTFLLTILVDLTIAIEVGIVLTSLIFIHRISKMSEITTQNVLKTDALNYEGIDEFAFERELPMGVYLFQLKGPFFFGNASRLRTIFDQPGDQAKVYIFDLAHVQLLDLTSSKILESFARKCLQHNAHIILVSPSPSIKRTLNQTRLQTLIPSRHIVFHLEEALELANQWIGNIPTSFKKRGSIIDGKAK